MASAHRIAHLITDSAPLPERPSDPPSRRTIDPDPRDVIAESKYRLERLAELTRRRLEGEEPPAPRSAVITSQRLSPAERTRCALAAGTVPCLLAVQAGCWESMHAAWHPLMLVPILLGLVGCLTLGLHHRLGESLRLSKLPLLLLLQTLLALALMALYQELAAATAFEHIMLGLALGISAAAAACAGLALLIAGGSFSLWGQRGLALGLTLAVGTIPFF